MKVFTIMLRTVWIVVVVCSPAMAQPTTVARVAPFYGYDDCIRLENQKTRVTLCPAAGGRVLEYAINGKNALYLPPGQEGWVYEPGHEQWWLYAGRFDIGPEQVIAKHPPTVHGALE